MASYHARLATILEDDDVHEPNLKDINGGPDLTNQDNPDSIQDAISEVIAIYMDLGNTGEDDAAPSAIVQMGTERVSVPAPLNVEKGRTAPGTPIESTSPSRGEYSGYAWTRELQAVEDDIFRYLGHEPAPPQDLKTVAGHCVATSTATVYLSTPEEWSRQLGESKLEEFATEPKNGSCSINLDFEPLNRLKGDSKRKLTENAAEHTPQELLYPLPPTREERQVNTLLDFVASLRGTETETSNDNLSARGCSRDHLENLFHEARNECSVCEHLPETLQMGADANSTPVNSASAALLPDLTPSTVQHASESADFAEDRLAEDHTWAIAKRALEPLGDLVRQRSNSCPSDSTASSPSRYSVASERNHHLPQTQRRFSSLATIEMPSDYESIHHDPIYDETLAINGLPGLAFNAGRVSVTSQSVPIGMQQNPVGNSAQIQQSATSHISDQHAVFECCNGSGAGSGLSVARRDTMTLAEKLAFYFSSFETDSRATTVEIPERPGTSDSTPKLVRSPGMYPFPGYDGPLSDFGVEDVVYGDIYHARDHADEQDINHMKPRSRSTSKKHKRNSALLRLNSFSFTSGMQQKVRPEHKPSSLREIEKRRDSDRLIARLVSFGILPSPKGQASEGGSKTAANTASPESLPATPNGLQRLKGFFFEKKKTSPVKVAGPDGLSDKAAKMLGFKAHEEDK